MHLYFSENSTTTNIHGLRIPDRDCFMNMSNLFLTSISEHKVLTLDKMKLKFVPIYGEIKVLGLSSSNQSTLARKSKNMDKRHVITLKDVQDSFFSLKDKLIEKIDNVKDKLDDGLANVKDKIQNIKNKLF